MFDNISDKSLSYIFNSYKNIVIYVIIGVVDVVVDVVVVSK